MRRLRRRFALAPGVLRTGIHGAARLSNTELPQGLEEGTVNGVASAAHGWFGRVVSHTVTVPRNFMATASCSACGTERNARCTEYRRSLPRMTRSAVVSGWPVWALCGQDNSSIDTG